MPTNSEDTVLEDLNPPRPTAPVVENHTHRRVSNTFGIGALAIASAATGVGVGLLTRSRRIGALAGAGTALVLAATRWQLQRLFTDEPTYEVERRYDALEIRRYPAMAIARTRIANADIDAARERGFRTLARYIFGGNHEHEHLAMTTPVTLTNDGTEHVMSFVMPAGRRLDTLPRPDDARVELAAEPERRVAAMTFRKAYRGADIGAMKEALRAAVADAGLETKGEPMFAGFDPPSTLPFLRRTEMWIELA